MPSLDTIRTITIRGQTEGVDNATAALNQLTESIQAVNDNLAKSTQVANDNRAGFAITGEGAASAANHLRQAAEAAYAFSPAFRGVVNEMAVPALRGAGTALEAVAGGIVTATNVAGTGIVRVGSAIETTVPALAGLGVGVKGAGAAMEAFSPTIGGAAVSIASKLLPALRLLGPALLIFDAVKLVAEAWQLGNEKLAEYVQLSEKAATAGLTTDFFQRLAKAAKDAKVPFDELAAAIAKLNEQTADTLGGTSAQQRLKALTDAGNFGGNSGLTQFANANTTEEKLRAITSLIDQAMQKGERLAALDVAKSFLGDAVAANLAKDAGYLDKMIASAAKVSASDLVSQASVDNAVALQNRLDAAEQILAQRFHPLQDLLVAGGIALKEAWVNIVENIAAAVDWATRLISKLGDAPSWFQNQLNRGASAFVDLTTTAESRAAAEAQFGISSNPADIALGAARQRLSAGLQNPANVAQATAQINAIQNKVFPDRSKDPDAIDATTAAYDRAKESLLKYIETTKAAADTVGKSVAEQEKAKAIAQLTAAAQKDGTKVTAEMRAEMEKLGQQAGEAAIALERAKVAADIKFNKNTALLSAEDVQIATQLKGIYPDVATALGSVEANGIRVNNAFKAIGQALEQNLTSGLTNILSGTKSVSQGFRDMANSIAQAIEQMIIKIAIVEPLLRSLQATLQGSGLLTFLSPAGTTTGLDGLAAIHHSGGVVGDPTMPARGVDLALFAGAMRFHSGGIVGDEVPIIARRGEVVGWPDQLAQKYGGGASQQNVHVTLIESPSAQGTVTRSQNNNGGFDIQIAIAQISAKSAAQPGGALNRVITDQFGARQRVTGR